MTEIITRLANADDLPSVSKMVAALADYNGDTSTLTLGTLRRDTLGDRPWIRVIVAEKGTEILGYAALCPLAQLQFGVRGMDIHHLFIVPHMRGQGVGAQLIKASIEHSKELGCRYITIGTQPENLPAQQVYLKAGFTPLPAPGPRYRMKFEAN